MEYRAARERPCMAIFPSRFRDRRTWAVWFLVSPRVVCIWERLSVVPLSDRSRSVISSRGSIVREGHARGVMSARRVRFERPGMTRPSTTTVGPPPPMAPVASGYGMSSPQAVPVPLPFHPLASGAGEA